MKTLIIYISEHERMSDRYRAFFQNKIDQKSIYVLEYSQAVFNKKNFQSVLHDELEHIVHAWQEWAIILAVDWEIRALNEELLNEESFLWKVIDCVILEVEDYVYREACMASVHVLIYSDLQQEPCGKDLMLSEELQKKVKSIAWEKMRFFICGNDQEERLYECRRMTYFLLVLYCAMGNVPIENYQLGVIYRLSACWDWEGFGTFISQMANQYEQMEKKFQEMIRNIEALELPALFADTASTPKVLIEHKSVLTKNDSKYIRKQLIATHHKLEREAAKGFQKIKGIFLRYDATQWNIDEIKEKIEEYEKELDILYIRETEDFEEKLNCLNELEQREKYYLRRCIIWEGIEEVLAIALLWSVIAGRSCALWFKGIMVVLAGFMLEYWYVYYRNKRAAIRGEYHFIEERIKLEQGRINREFSLMTDYRNEFHRYYEWVNGQKRQKEVNKEAAYMLEQIKTRKEWLNWLKDLLPAMRNEAAQTECGLYLLQKKESLHYVIDWQKKYFIRVNGDGERAFPYPFICSVCIVRAKEQIKDRIIEKRESREKRDKFDSSKEK